MQPFLSPEECAEFYQCLLTDTFDLVKGLEDIEKYIAYSSVDQKGYFDNMEKKGFRLFPQAEGDLGQRLADATGRFLMHSENHVVVIGSDSPTLPIGYLGNSFTQLESHDVVIGPTKDGGYYLIGLSKPIPELFQDIEWSTQKVFKQTEEKLRQLKASYVLLPSWHDLDTKEDLEYLHQQWNKPSPENNPQIAPKTREFIVKKLKK